jgi:stage II sporulation protein D (peptidoglycan lytic transglycosylase)
MGSGPEINVGRPTEPPPYGSDPSEQPWRVLAIPLASLLSIALFLLATGEPPPPPKPAQGLRTTIRVMLVKSAPEVSLELEGSWKIVPKDSEQAPLVVNDLGEVKLSAASWSLAGATTTQLPDVAEVSIEPTQLFEGPDPVIVLQGRSYRGAMRVRRQGGSLRVINAVELEDYLAGVIGHEMPLSWEDEAVKAQAIAARSYALRERKPQRDYDVESDTRSQVYRGVMRNDARAQAMVRATMGLVLTHKGQMVTTYFHSTCGGDTIPATWVFKWIKEDTPPLMGARDCTCQPSKYYRFETPVDFRKVRQLRVALPLRKLEVIHYPRGNYVKELVLTGAKGKVQRWHGYSQARSYLRLKAPAFTATLDEDGLGAVFNSRGWGHGVGMCQFGANGFAKRGLSAAEIMLHFYPETELTTYVPE